MLKSRIIAKRLEAGCDEVGRGCLAGPVVAAAVILPPRFRHPALNDSKKLSEKKRVELTKVIRECALAYAVSFVPPVIIDRINILQASFLAMQRAVSRLAVQPEHLLIDGNRFDTSSQIPYTCIVKGDAKVGSIAAASILAKTYRDAYMRAVHEAYPSYAWHQNVGYPTEDHREALKQLGPTPLHRRSFHLKNEQLVLDF